MPFWKDWIPPEVIDEDQCMGEVFIDLRNWVKKNRNFDITLPLYVYEFRVILSEIQMEILDGSMYTWKDIASDVDDFECLTDHGIYVYRTPGKRELKKCYLIGSMEFMLWQLGNFKEQYMYPIPETLNKIDSNIVQKDQFLYGQPIDLSFKVFHNFFSKYFRSQSVNLFSNSDGDDNDLYWYVYVPGDIWFYYFGKYKDNKDKKIKKKNVKTFSKTFLPLKDEMSTINFSKKNEAVHAAIANFISWQRFLREFDNDKRGIKMKIPKITPSIITDYNKLSDQMKQAVLKIIKKPSVCRLIESDRELLKECINLLPKDSKLNRFIRFLFHREKIAKHYYEADRKRRQQDEFVQLIKDKIVSFVKFISLPWKPPLAGVHVNSSDISEQSHRYKLDNNGDVSIYCLWREAYKEDPAYIKIRWNANISAGNEIWVAFFQPETKEFFSEIMLGINSEGGKVLLSNQLNFDPYKQKWAVSVILKPRKRIN
ncbi:hypothetical protein MHK_006207 [Candidatus Magnetomorum sp. HK-1]|nr:hypothetical protein MHK_006207 [Candidatus Magnetomorum sp. HK-1]